jgi:CBS domain containing-hemolysin-like protein
MLPDVLNLELGLLLLGVVALVVANGFFVAAEFALIGVRRTRIDQLANEGHRRARVVQHALYDLDSYIAATQLGITMASLGLGWIGEPALGRLLDPLLVRLLGHDGVWLSAQALSFALAFAAITTLHIVLGELAPKTVALQRAERTALAVAGPLHAFLLGFRPIIRAMNGLGRAVVRPLGLSASSEHAAVHSEEELSMLVAASTRGGALTATEQAIIERAFGFADEIAADVMLPRTELIGIDIDASPAEARALLAEFPRERFPVHAGAADNIIGILHAPDALAALIAAPREALDVRALMRPALHLPASASLEQVLVALRHGRTHVAVVVDEFGGAAGLIELERVIERLLGPLPDEFVFARPTPAGDATAPPVLDGLLLVQDINERYGIALDASGARTLGGLVFFALGRAPRLGDSVEMDGVRLSVAELDGLRVAAVALELPGDNTDSR